MQARISKTKDEDMDCNDLHPFAETFKVEEEEWATACGCQDLSDMAHTQDSMMFESGRKPEITC